MASQREIRRRIGAVRNIKQITRAMQFVAAMFDIRKRVSNDPLPMCGVSTVFGSAASPGVSTGSFS